MRPKFSFGSRMKNIKFLGIPFSAGQPHSGVELAPDAFRKRDFIERLPSRVIDLGDLDFHLCGEKSSGVIKNEKISGMGNALISRAIETEDLSHSFLLNVGGDHGLALGTIHGLLHHYPDLIVVWADAHGDINTPQSSQSGNFHGMPLSFLINGPQGSKDFLWMKKLLRPERLIYMGPRDLDPAEKIIIEELGIQWYSSDDMNNFGTERLLKHALQIADPTGKGPIHLSFDVDVFDARDVESTGTKVIDGPKKCEVMKLGKLLGESGRLRSMDLVEVNPEIGHEMQLSETLELATRFTLSVTEAVFAHAPVFYPHPIFPSPKNYYGVSA